MVRMVQKTQHTQSSQLSRPSIEVAGNPLRVMKAIAADFPSAPDQYGMAEADFEMALQAAAPEIAEDLEAHLRRDPAARDANCIDNVRTGHTAVAYHRVIQQLKRQNEGNTLPGFNRLIETLSQKAKAKTGIDLHPDASIGPRCVIDHGQGTSIGQGVRIGADLYALDSVVIGETSALGADVYLQKGVTLGALSIAENPDGPRHPTLGDRVEIGAHTKIYGNIRIGDDAFIGPGSIIDFDVPDGARHVSRDALHVLQLAKQDGAPPSEKHEFHGLVRDEDRTTDILHIHGSALGLAQIDIVDINGRSLDANVAWRLTYRSDCRVTFSLNHVPPHLDHRKICIGVKFPCGEHFVITRSAALKSALQSIQRKLSHHAKP